MAAAAVAVEEIWKAVSEDDDDEVPDVEVPLVDETGKFHGDIPKDVPDEWSRDDIEVAIDQIEKSLRVRQDLMEKLGNKGNHGRRINQEELFLRQLRRALEKRK